MLGRLTDDVLDEERKALLGYKREACGVETCRVLVEAQPEDLRE